MNPQHRHRADLVRLLILQNPTLTLAECESLASDLLGGRVRNFLQDCVLFDENVPVDPVPPVNPCGNPAGIDRD